MGVSINEIATDMIEKRGSVMSLQSPPICNFGAPATEFSLVTPSGDTHTLASTMGEKGLVLMFICNHCPYVVAVIERLVEDAKAMQAAGIGVVAVMSNDVISYPADAPDKMVHFAQRYGFTFPYLFDESQETARAYGAVCTPDFFGYNKDGGLQYRGRIDECRPGATPQQIENRTPELLNAMLQIAETENGPREQVASAGCSIKWR